MAEESAEERATAEALEALPRDRWRVLHDVPWPGRPRDVVEHVVVGPAGVFVIDTKTWSGTVTVRAGVLRLDRYSRQGARDPRGRGGQGGIGPAPHGPLPGTPGAVPGARRTDLDRLRRRAGVQHPPRWSSVLQSQHRVLPEVQIQRLARDLSGQALPLTSAGASTRRRRPGRGVTYLTGALAALLVALTLVASPDVVRDAVEGAASWVADLVDERLRAIHRSQLVGVAARRRGNPPHHAHRRRLPRPDLGHRRDCSRPTVTRSRTSPRSGRRRRWAWCCGSTATARPWSPSCGR